jgi:hypothetical protein
LLHADKKGSLRAIGLTLLAVVLLAPVVQPWYLLWGLVLLAPVATGWIKRWLIILSVGAVFLGLPGGEQLLHDFRYSNRLYVAVALLVLLGVFLAPLGKVRPRGAADAAERIGMPDAVPGTVEASNGHTGAGLELDELADALVLEGPKAPHPVKSGARGHTLQGHRPREKGLEHVTGPAPSVGHVGTPKAE